MMLAKILGDQGAKANRISTRATLTMRVDSSGAKITKLHLATEIAAEGMSAEKVQQAAAQAKDQCPVSQLLKPGLENLSFEAKLVS
jgi:osmotically inducible protein OsmC